MSVWGIASNEDAATVAAYKDYTGATYPFLLDTDGSVLNAYSQELAFWSAAYPQDWVIGTDGEVAYLNNAYAPDEIRAILDEQLSGD